MALRSEAERKAENFTEKIKEVFHARDNLICSVESGVKKPNVISPSTVGSRDAWVEVTLYNVSDPKDAIPAHVWMRFGEMGADVDTFEASRHNAYNPTIELHKRFD